MSEEVESLELEVLKEAKALDKEMTKYLGDKYYGISSGRVIDPVRFIPSGSYSLDKIIGGGIPVGRIIECFGPESSGKTLIMQTIAAEFQKAFHEEKKFVAIIDVENSIDPVFAKCLGLDLEKVALVNHLENLEEVLETCRMFVKNGNISFLGVDSICAVPPQGIQDRKVGEDTMALAARFLSRHIPELAKEAAKNGCTIFIINQTRSSLKMYGNPEVTTGGAAIKYHSSVRLRTSKKEPLKSKEGNIGVVLGVTAVKNKCGPPLRQEEISIYFPHYDEDGNLVAGIDKISDVIKRAIELEIISKAGSWFSYKDYKVQGEESLKKTLTKDDISDLKKELNEKENFRRDDSE